MEKIEDIYKFLDAVRERPKIYIGEDAMSNLWYLLLGYEIGLSNDKYHPVFGRWNSEFNAYVAKRFPEIPHRSVKSYCQIILEHSAGDELKALDLFFNLFDDFRAQEKQTHK